jgi:seryl-tRNA synthetase
MQKGEDNMEVRTTEDGLLRAFGMLVNQQSSRQVKQKRFYREMGNNVHATRPLSKLESKQVKDLLDKLKALNPRDEASKDQAQAILKLLSVLPVKFVPVKHEQRIDSSKTYPYASKRQGY